MEYLEDITTMDNIGNFMVDGGSNFDSYDPSETSELASNTFFNGSEITNEVLVQQEENTENLGAEGSAPNDIDVCIEVIDTEAFVVNYNQDLFNTENLSFDILEQINSGCDFDMSTWENLCEDDKISKLCTLEDNMANLLGRSAVEINFKDLTSESDILLGSKSYGYFDRASNEIYINSSLLNSSEDLPEIVNTVIHEGVHAYQYQCVYDGLHHDDPNQVEEWAENFANYKKASEYGMETYVNQPLELHANAVAYNITNSLFQTT